MIPTTEEVDAEMREVTFDNLIFRTDPDGVARARYGFGKYQLSVILEPGKKLYEAAIFDEQKNFVQLPGIHRHPEYEDDFVDDVIPFLNEKNITGIMRKLQFVQRHEELHEIYGTKSG